MSREAGEAAYERLKQSMARDKTLPEGFMSLLRADLDTVLKAYFEYGESDLRAEITPWAGEGYTLTVTLSAPRAKQVKLL